MCTMKCFKFRFQSDQFTQTDAQHNSLRPSQLCQALEEEVFNIMDMLCFLAIPCCSVVLLLSRLRHWCAVHPFAKVYRLKNPKHSEVSLPCGIGIHATVQVAMCLEKISMCITQKNQFIQIYLAGSDDVVISFVRSFMLDKCDILIQNMKHVTHFEVCLQFICMTLAAWPVVCDKRL